MTGGTPMVSHGAANAPRDPCAQDGGPITQPLARVVVAQRLGKPASRAEMKAFLAKIDRTVANVTRGLSRSDREELVQELAIKLLDADITKPHESSLVGWIRTAAVRWCGRQRRRRVPVVEFKEASVEIGLDHKLEWQRLLSQLAEVAAGLPDGERALLVLDLLGYQSVDLASGRSCPEGTIRARLSRLRGKLSKLLGGEVEIDGLARTNIDATSLCMILLGELDSRSVSMNTDTIRRLAQKAMVMLHDSLRTGERRPRK